MKTQHSKVMTIANKLVMQGYNRTNAMAKAWILVKMPLVETKVAGVTYGKRQKAIEHLSRYQLEQISIHLMRDHDNAYDRNLSLSETFEDVHQGVDSRRQALA